MNLDKNIGWYFIHLNNSYTTIALYKIANSTTNRIQSKYFFGNNSKFIDGGNDDIKHHLLLPSSHFEKDHTLLVHFNNNK